MMSKPGGGQSSGISLGDALRLPKRHPAWRRREAQSGSGTERENLHGDVKGKAQAAPTAKPKVPMRRLGADCLVVAWKRGNARGAKGAGHRRWIGSTDVGSTDSGRSPILNGRRQPSCDGTSRMNREVHVRFCEGLGVKFPRPTRPTLPTWAVQPVGSYLGYTGRDGDVVVTAAHDPGCVKTLCVA